MAARLLWRLALALALLASLAPGVAQAQAPSARGEARFKISTQEPEQPASEQPAPVPRASTPQTPAQPAMEQAAPKQPAPGQPIPGQPAQEQPAPGQPLPAIPESAWPAPEQPATAQPAPAPAGDPSAQSVPAPTGQPSAQAAPEAGQTAQPVSATPDKATKDAQLPEPKPEDDLPPPMSVEGEPKPAQPAPQAAPHADSQVAKPSSQPAFRIIEGKPLEIVPIQEGKLSAVGGQPAKPAQAKPAQVKSGQAKAEKAKPEKTKSIKAAPRKAKSGKAKAAQARQGAGRKAFWLDPRRREADLRFKQGSVAFILGADIGRRGAYKTFYLDNPPRRVVDIPGRWRYEGPTNHAVRFDGVDSIRVGEHPDFLRIVFDYTRGEAKPPLVQTTPDGVAVIYFWGE